MPPQTSWTISRMEIPMGTSTSPPRRILPAMAKTLVPLLLAVPRRLKACAPFRTIQGTLAKVSTLLMQVGHSHRPLTAGKGGRTRGMPRRPSIEAMRAVSSPQTKAPAPSFSSTRNSNPVPKTLSPRRRRASAWAMAMFSRSTAIGYSART